MSSSSRTARDDGGRSGHPIGVRGDLAPVLGEHTADRLDPEAMAMFVDEGDYRGGRGRAPGAKKAEAAFKISFARRSSKFSFSSSFIRPLVSGQPGPLAGIRLSPPDPLSKRLVVDRQLRCDRLRWLSTARGTRFGDRRPSARPVPGLRADRDLVPPCSSLALLHPLKGRSSHQSRGGSLRRLLPTLPTVVKWKTTSSPNAKPSSGSGEIPPLGGAVVQLVTTCER